MISVSAKMLYQEVMENFLRSGKSQAKVRENESREKMATLLMKFRRVDEDGVSNATSLEFTRCCYGLY